MSDFKINFCLIFSLILSIFSTQAHDHSQSFLMNKQWTMVGSINVENWKGTFEFLTNNDIDIAGVDRKENIIDVLIDVNEYNFLVKNSFNIFIHETKGVSAAPDTQYKNPEEIEYLLKDYHDRFPEITKLISIGKSVEGRDIWALKISDNPDIQEIKEPAILFNSMHHAREIMTPEVSLDVIDYLLHNYLKETKVTNWIESNQIWVIPMLNVDGNHKMWNEDKYWRKNTRGGYGVDLNRNYPSTWKKCNGSSGWRTSDTYRGPKPGSEPETQAMMDFIKTIRPVFNISYHSYSELVLYPYGCSPDRAANKDVVEGIGKEIASLLNYQAGTPWELLYNADGGDIDWMLDEYQVIPFVIELNSRKQGFHPDYKKWRDKTVIRNRSGWQHLLDRLDQSAVRGYVKGVNFDPANLVVRIEQNESKLLEYPVQENGVFHIVLEPGNYLVKILDGKMQFLEKNIKIEDKVLELNIEL